jgi:hypothetical protein
MLVVGGYPVMASKNDDLEEVLQQNLKLRRELVAEVASANRPKRVTGWGIIYWVGLVLIPVLILCGIAFVFRYTVSGE